MATVETRPTEHPPGPYKTDAFELLENIDQILVANRHGLTSQVNSDSHLYRFRIITKQPHDNQVESVAIDVDVCDSSL